ncbi:HEAT repeat domain-containing protein [Myxococcota bacterium]|nr:HEAT repeat domain-containing protein [Myxococcota bacterium]
MTKSETPKKPKVKSADAADPVELLVSMLSHERAERRSAAAIVLTELAPEGEHVLEALRAAVKRTDDAPLRRWSAEAIGALGPKSIVTDLQHLLKDSERVVRETASRVLASGKGVKASDIAKMLEGNDEKERIAAIVVLGAMGGRDARQRLVTQLPGASTRVLNAVVDALRPMLQGATGDDVQGAIEDVAKVLDGDTIRDDPDLAIAVLQLLGNIPGEGAIDIFLDVASGDTSPEVRTAAIDAIRRVTKGKRSDPKVFKALLSCVEDPKEANDVVVAAIEGLSALEVPLALEPKVRALVTSESAMAKRWAIGALGQLDTAPAAKSLAKVVETGDPADRELSLDAAKKTASGRQELARLLGRTPDQARARQISAALRTAGEELEQGTRQILEDAVIEATPESAEIIIELLKHVGGKSAGKVQDSLLDKAVRLKKKGQYSDAIAIFRSICHGPSADPEARFHLGVCELKISKKVISRGPSSDPCLTTLGALSKAQFPVVERLKKEKALEPEDLYYLGFSFAEGKGTEQALGGDILSWLAEEAPDTKLGKMAKNKLVTMGWEE